MVLVLLSGCVLGGRWRRRSRLGASLLARGQKAGSRSGIRIVVDVAILDLVVDLHLNSCEHGRIHKATWEVSSVRHTTYALIAQILLLLHHNLVIFNTFFGRWAHVKVDCIGLRICHAFHIDGVRLAEMVVQVALGRERLSTPRCWAMVRFLSGV